MWYPHSSNNHYFFSNKLTPSSNLWSDLLVAPAAHLPVVNCHRLGPGPTFEVKASNKNIVMLDVTWVMFWSLFGSKLDAIPHFHEGSWFAMWKVAWWGGIKQYKNKIKLCKVHGRLSAICNNCGLKHGKQKMCRYRDDINIPKKRDARANQWKTHMNNWFKSWSVKLPVSHVYSVYICQHLAQKITQWCTRYQSHGWLFGWCASWSAKKPHPTAADLHVLQVGTNKGIVNSLDWFTNKQKCRKPGVLYHEIYGCFLHLIVPILKDKEWHQHINTINTWCPPQPLNGLQVFYMNQATSQPFGRQAWSRSQGHDSCENSDVYALYGFM